MQFNSLLHLSDSWMLYLCIFMKERPKKNTLSLFFLFFIEAEQILKWHLNHLFNSKTLEFNMIGHTGLLSICVSKIHGCP